MMKMSQTVQGRGLTGVRVDPEDLGECLKIRILQLQILAAPFANPISAMPVVAQGIPPHVDGRVERVLREEPPKNSVIERMHALRIESGNPSSSMIWETAQSRF